MEKVCICEKYFITGWPSFGSNNFLQRFPVIEDQFWTSDFAPQVQQYSGNIWCEPPSWSHAKVSHLVSGPDWSLLEGVFSSDKAILFLMFFCALGHCSPNFCWTSKMTLHCPSNCPDTLGSSFFVLMIPNFPVPEAAKQPLNPSQNIFRATLENPCADNRYARMF